MDYIFLNLVSCLVSYSVNIHIFAILTHEFGSLPFPKWYSRYLIAIILTMFLFISSFTKVIPPLL